MSKLLDKTLNILELMADTKKDEVGLSELAELSGINITTVGRILATLARRGYLYKSNINKKYSLGYKFLELGYSVIFTKSLKRIALPSLIKLNQTADETVFMISWNGKQAIRIAVVMCRHPLQIVEREEGSIFDLPLHASAQGKVILANMTNNYLDEYFKNHSLEACTPNTITNIDDLKQHLALVNRNGFAISDEELSLGVRSIAAAIKTRHNHFAGAVCIAGPSIRLTRSRLTELVPAVMSCALEISKALGYEG